MRAKDQGELPESHSAAQRRALLKYVKRTAALLHLRDWEFEVSPEPASEEAAAQIVVPAAQKRAVLYVCPNFFTQSPSWQRQTICHELIHCHLAATRGLLERFTREMGETREADVLFSSLDFTLEMATDGLADAFATAAELPALA